MNQETKDWILERTEHFIARWENGNLEASDCCYEIFRGFTSKGISPKTIQDKTNVTEGSS